MRAQLVALGSQRLACWLGARCWSCSAPHVCLQATALLLLCLLQAGNLGRWQGFAALEQPVSLPVAGQETDCWALTLGPALLVLVQPVGCSAPCCLALHALAHHWWMGQGLLQAQIAAGPQLLDHHLLLQPAEGAVKVLGGSLGERLLSCVACPASLPWVGMPARLPAAGVLLLLGSESPASEAELLLPWQPWFWQGAVRHLLRRLHFRLHLQQLCQVDHGEVHICAHGVCDASSWVTETAACPGLTLMVLRWTCRLSCRLSILVLWVLLDHWKGCLAWSSPASALPLCSRWLGCLQHLLLGIQGSRACAACAACISDAQQVTCTVSVEGRGLFSWSCSLAASHVS